MVHNKLTNEQLRERADKKVKSLRAAIDQSAFTNIRRDLEEELQLAEYALAALQEYRKVAGETRGATCPKCRGSGGDDFSKDGKCVMCCGTGGGGLR